MNGRLTRLPCDPFLWGQECPLRWYSQENIGMLGLEMSLWWFLCGLLEKKKKGYDNWKFFRYRMIFGWMKRERIRAGSFGGWIFTVWPVFLCSFISKVEKQSQAYSWDYVMLCSLDWFLLFALDQLFRLSICSLEAPLFHDEDPVPTCQEKLLQIKRSKASSDGRLWQN